jgi:hypothetical protein
VHRSCKNSRDLFETPRSLSSGAHSRDPLAAPQGEVRQISAG